MRAARGTLGVGLAVCAAGLVACAGLVGADFSDAHLPQSTGSGANDSGTVGTGADASAPPVIVADGGACPTGLSDCGGICVDLQTDPAHCGKCTTTCPTDPHGPAVCVTAGCSLACTTGWSRCGNACCSSTSGADAAPDTGPVDAGPPDTGPTDPGIACGATNCAAGASYCCGGPLTGSVDDRCSTSANDQCSWDLRCDDRADCPSGQGGGQVCCYDDTLAEAFCAASCTGSQLQLCDPQVAGECQGGLACTGSFSKNGLQDVYAACQ